MIKLECKLCGYVFHGSVDTKVCPYCGDPVIKMTDKDFPDIDSMDEEQINIEILIRKGYWIGRTGAYAYGLSWLSVIDSKGNSITNLWTKKNDAWFEAIQRTKSWATSWVDMQELWEDITSGDHYISVSSSPDGLHSADIHDHDDDPETTIDSGCGWIQIVLSEGVSVPMAVAKIWIKLQRNLKHA
jgi:hypothetical protein